MTSIQNILNWLDLPSSIACSESDISSGIYVYGAGELGSLCLEFCEACGIKILAFLDRNQTQPMRSSTGNYYRVAQPDSKSEIFKKGCPIVVAIATQPFGPICEELRLGGWTIIFPFYNLTTMPRRGHPLQNGWQLGHVSDKERDTVTSVCDSLADEASLLHYEAFLAWHRDNSELELDGFPIIPDRRYVIKESLEFLFSRRKLMIDVGAHRGEAVTRLRKAGSTFDEYVLFEPDHDSCAHLAQHKSDLVPISSSLTIHEKVLSSGKGLAGFQSGLGYCSQLWSRASEYRTTCALDDFELRPDLIKIHTEGSELSILKGAKDTVRRSHPLIVYSVYHRREGFYSDIFDAMEMFPGYRWYFRLHSYQGTGAFIYAIPQKTNEC